MFGIGSVFGEEAADVLDRLAGSGLLGFFLGATDSGAPHAAVNHDLSGEHSSVVRTARRDVVFGCGRKRCDRKLLEPGLVVGAARSLGQSAVDQRRPQFEDQSARSVESGIEIDRTDYCFEGIAENRLLVSPTGRPFAFAEQQCVAKFDRSGNLSECCRIDHAGPQLCQLTFGKLGIAAIDLVRDDQTENGVTKKLKPLVGRTVAVLGAPAPMCQSKRKQ